MHNNVLIEPFSDEEKGSKTKSGIFIPETVDKEKARPRQDYRSHYGKRDSEGKLIPMSVKKGQKVVFSKYGTR